MRAVGKVTSCRACGAVVFSPIISNVLVNFLPICTIGAMDSHGGIAMTGSPNVVAGGIPVCGLGDVSAICPWVQPPHFMQPLVWCDFNVVMM